MTSGWLASIAGIFYFMGSVYLLISGILATRASGFRFYLIARLISGILLALISLAYFTSGIGNGGILILLNMGWLLPLIWERLQQSNTHELHPDRWREWEIKARQDHRIKRFFYFNAVAPYQPQDKVDESTMSSSKFWLAMAFMTVLAFMGIALTVLVLLGRRGF